MDNFGERPRRPSLRSCPTRRSSDLGAEPMLIADDATRDACTALAIKAAQAVGIRFASIDVVRADGAWKVLEVNSGDRKSTRLNSSHMSSSYAVSCLKKKTTETTGEV